MIQRRTKVLMVGPARNEQGGIAYHTSTTPLLSYVWLTGFGYGFARALVREGAPYSNPEPS